MIPQIKGKPPQTINYSTLYCNLLQHVHLSLCQTKQEEVNWKFLYDQGVRIKCDDLLIGFFCEFYNTNFDMTQTVYWNKISIEKFLQSFN